MSYIDKNGKVLYCTFCDNEAHYVRDITYFCVTCHEAFEFGQGSGSDGATHLDDVENVKYKE